MRTYEQLGPDNRTEIWMLWQQRDTIESLAREFKTTKEVIRKIIALPRPG